MNKDAKNIKVYSSPSFKLTARLITYALNPEGYKWKVAHLPG